jgi:PAS domain S-box-containing protein
MYTLSIMTDKPRDTIQVLHVEDDPNVRELTVLFLEQEGQRVTVEPVANASEALSRLADTGYDCLVSDYDMPGKNGLELLDVVREEYDDLPFILYTGKGSEEIASEAIARGVTDYLQKGSGAEQYDILANRITNAVEQHRATQRTAELERIRRVIMDVNRALVHAETRSEIERQVCEIISTAEPYCFAWLGEHDPETRTVKPRASVGVEDGYLADIEITTDEDPTGQGPTGRAIRTHELAVMQNIPENPDFEPWREDALERGYRSSAAIPLVYDETLYGVLNVYADRTYAFDQMERELLTELADDIAHALYRVTVRTRLRRTERIIDDLPVGVYRRTAGPDGELVDANATFAEILDAESVAELFEHDVSEFYVDAETLAAFSEQLQSAGIVRDREIRIETLAGDEIRASVTGIRTEENGEVYFDGILQNITERKERERKIAHSKARFEGLFEQSPDMVFVHDANGEIIEVNEQVHQTLGYTRDEVVGKSVWDIDQTVDREDKQELWDEMRVDDSSIFEGSHVRKDGSSIPVEVHLARIESEDEEFLAIARDVSQHQEYERRLEAHSATLQRRNERLQEFADVIVHDVSNHLNVAQTYLELIEATDEDHIDRIETAHERIADLTEEMQTIVNAGERVQETEVIDLSTVAESCWGSCCIDSDPATVTVVRDGQIQANESRLKQLFENLFWNACEHADDDVTVRVGRTDDGFYVADDGPGIPDEERPKVLSPGYTTAENGHAGFGLAIVREIADAHGWELRVTDSDAGGARFEFTDVTVVEESRSA